MATAKILIVAGGGNGNTNRGGGGGGGGLIYKASHTLTGQNYTVTVGGAASDSVFDSLTAKAGGSGGTFNGGSGGSGGSGGGGGGGSSGNTGPAGSATQPSQPGDSGTYGFGNNAGTGFASGTATHRAGGGGGGANASGGSASDSVGGNGGAGKDMSAVFGTGVGASGIFAGGGGGSGNGSGSGGTGGGGAGSLGTGANGTANTGGGGGGGHSGSGGSGGSGVVIIRYTTADFGTCSGGTMSTIGSETMHVFTSSGTLTMVSLPTVTTQAVSSIAATTATGNGNITATGNESASERGVVYSTSSQSDPGNVAPASSSYSGVVTETGTFSTGAFTESITGLTSRTTYYVRAYAKNSAGYSYGAEVSFTTIGFTNPGNAYTSDNTYATLAATSGDLYVEVSKDGGSNWSAPLMKTFGGSDTLETYGNGSTELWGLSLTRADMTDTNFRVRVSQGSISQVYKGFGFTTATDTLTGLEIAIEAKYSGGTISIDLLKVKIYYGTSILPVQAGSLAYASNGRKNGEGAGSGTGVIVFYDGTAWRACDTGATVAA